MKFPAHLGKKLVFNFQISVLWRTRVGVQIYSGEIRHKQSLQKLNGLRLRELDFKGIQNFAAEAKRYDSYQIKYWLLLQI